MCGNDKEKWRKRLAMELVSTFLPEDTGDAQAILDYAESYLRQLDGDEVQAARPGLVLAASRSRMS